MKLEDETQALVALAESNDGILQVDDVIEAAKDFTSPLHRHFTWDDTEAAEKCRRIEARALIASCNITIESRPETQIRAFVSLETDRRNGGGYRLTRDIKDDAAMVRELLGEMYSRVNYWERQLLLFTAISTKPSSTTKVVEAMNNLRAELGSLI